MSEITNTATIKVVADTSEVEVGLRKVDEAAAKTGRNLDTLGNSSGLDKLGDGAQSASNKFAFGTKGIIEAIEKRTQAMELGKRGTVEYYAALGNQKGINPAVLKPYLDQLDAVTRKTAQAAEAQAKMDSGEKFLASLRSQAEEIGKTSSELMELRAAQLGVSESAQPMIDQLREAEEAAGGMGGALGISKEALIGFAAGIAGAFSIGALVAGVSSAIDSLADLDDMAQKTGSSVENLSRLQKVAAVVGQDFGAVDGAVQKLAKGMAGLDEDSNKVNSALKRLGISSRDAAGNLRDPSEVFVEAAKSLQDYNDDAGKTLLANDLLSKSGADLLPFMNDVAESIDGFAGATASAAKDAADFQDGMGFLRVKSDELYTSLATRLLPAMTDLIGAFGDVAKNQNDLLDSDISGWADNLAVGLARVADVAILIPRILSTIAGSFKVVATDVSSFGTVFENANPVAAIRKLINGKPVSEELKAAIAERNKVLADANKAYEELWNKPANQFEQAILKRLSDRAKVVKDGMDAAFPFELLDGGKPSLGGKTDDGAKDRTDELARQVEAYKALAKAIDERVAATAREAAGLPELNQAQKLQASLDEQILEGKIKIGSMEKAFLEQKIQAVAANLEIIDSQKRAAQGAEDWAKMAKAQADAAAKSVEEAIKQADANERLAETFGLTKSEIEALELARLEEQLAQRASSGITLDEIATLEKLIDAKKRSAGATSTVQGMTDGKKALDELDKFLDPSRAKDFGDALQDAFGAAGSALSKLTGTLENYGKRQAEIDKQRKNAVVAFANGTLSESGYQEKVLELSRRSTKEQIGGYGQMASAAAGFFSEQSKGYKTMQTVSQAFHAAELAMTLAELIPKGISAVLNQGNGDPYSAFARMAAMAALVAGLGVAISGSSSAGGAKAVDVQKTQGTGSVFGDSDAKSDSITRALELIEKNTYQGLTYSAGMLASLRNIESSISGLGNIVAGSPGVMSGTDLGIQTGEFRNNQGFIAQAIGGWVSGPMTALVSAIVGKTSKTIVDSGIQFGGSLGGLQSGDGFNQYASVDTTVRKWWGLSKNTTNAVTTAPLSDELSNQFGMIFTGLEEVLRGAATGLGLSADDVSKSLDDLVLATTTLSLKDLKGDELTAAINAVVSKAMDEVSAAAFPGLAGFRKVGEGFAETVVRIATDFQAINTVFESFGKTFGQIGLESIVARERLIEMSGGLEQFTKQGEFFLTNFFSEEEQAAALKKRIQPTLQSFGLSADGEGATKAFRDYVVALDTTTKSGAEAYSTLMLIAPALTEIAKAGQGIIDQRKNLSDELDELTMTPEQMLAKRRQQFEPSNLDLFDQVEAAKAANTATASAKSAADALAATNKAYQDQIDGFIKSNMTLTELRALETAGMDATTIALYDVVAGYKAAAVEKAAANAKANAITSANNSFQSQIDEYLKLGMTASELRAFEIKDMDASTVALYDKLTALKAEKDEQDRIAQASRDQAAADQQAAEAAAQAAKALREAYQSVTDSIFDEVARIRGLLGTKGQSLAGAQAEFTITSAQARAGDLDAAKLLPQLSQTLLGLAEESASSLLELQRIRAQTAASLAATGSLLASQGGITPRSFAVGTNYLPTDMLIQAHAGERIIPAADNRALFAAIDRSSQQADPAAAAQAQKDMKGLRAEVRSVAISSDKTARLLARALQNDVLSVNVQNAVLKTQEQPA